MFKGIHEPVGGEISDGIEGRTNDINERKVSSYCC
jgi:hypothetical protein